MEHLDVLESRTIYILREAFNKIDKLAMLWSLGKDSNAMLWMARKAFFGHVPFPLVHIDTGKKFPEMYAFRERYAKEWNLDLKTGTCPPVEEMDPTLPPAARSAARKTAGLNKMLEKEKFTGLIAGIRRDEEGTRAKERVFSPRGGQNKWDFRDQPPEFWDQFKTDFAPDTHIRVHPILQWTEIDIWRYIQREGIPIVDLYFSRNGKRYRSLGDQDITFPVNSEASTLDEIIEELHETKIAERSGRAMDHESEDAFERLRADGYM
jgi:sulfate adenylyltransferase subunit 2